MCVSKPPSLSVGCLIARGVAFFCVGCNECWNSPQKRVPVDTPTKAALSGAGSAKQLHSGRAFNWWSGCDCWMTGWSRKPRWNPKAKPVWRMDGNDETFAFHLHVEVWLRLSSWSNRFLKWWFRVNNCAEKSCDFQVERILDIFWDFPLICLISMSMTWFTPDFTRVSNFRSLQTCFWWLCKWLRF